MSVNLAMQEESSPPGRKSLLVVDDDESIANMVARQLQAEGLKVATANDGQAAINWCNENGEPDLLLTDVCMPGLDGPGLYEQLSQEFPTLPVLYVSATADLDDERITPLLRKPYEFRDLLALVYMLLGFSA